MNRLFCYALALLSAGFTWSGPAFANVVGVDTQNFNPTNDGLDFVTVQSSKTLRPGLINVGVFLNYAVNSLPNYEDVSTQSRTNFRDTLLSSDTNFGLGVTRNFEIGMSLPMLLAQTVHSDLNTYGGQFTSTGVTEFRVMSKLHLFGGRSGGMAGIFTANFNEIQNDPFIGLSAGPTYNFELAADTLVAKHTAWAVNAGYRLRHPGSQVPGVPIQPLGNQYIASTAFSYLFTSWDTKVIAEVFSSYPVKTQQFISDRKSSSAEALLGIKTDISHSLAFHFGGGTELMHGTSSPGLRVYSGLNWVIGPVFDKPKPKIVRVHRQPMQMALEEINSSVDPFAGPPQPKEDFVIGDVLFEFNSDQIKPDFKDLLQRLVKYVLQPPALKSLVIEGHTDSIGQMVYNLDLSRRRAEGVRTLLISMGLPAVKITALGLGPTRPIASNGNFQGRMLNRRVEFKVQR